MKQDDKDLLIAVAGTVLVMAVVIGLALATALVSFYAGHGGGQ